MARYGSLALTLVVLVMVAGDAAADGSGGAVAPGPPAVKTISCLSSSVCRSRDTVVRGQELIIRGRDLVTVKQVVFAGARGAGDDATAKVSRTTERSAVAVVPVEAKTGPVVLQGSSRSSLARVDRVKVRRAPKVAPLDISPGSSFYFGGRRKATFEFMVDQPADVRVELVNDESQAIVDTWDVAAEPGVAQRIRWNGKLRGGVAGTGRYSFRLVAPASASAEAVPDATDAFFFADHLFPIRGRHDLGQTPTNGFGGGGTRAHYGQDMFANCGTKLAAARGGKVQFAGYHSAAGNYVVIDGAGTGRDYVYMHLLETPLVKTGDRVFTGQKIGEVGETGRASGCHLHFEMWSAPGWYQGGKAFDPLPALRIWDRNS